MSRGAGRAGRGGRGDYRPLLALLPSSDSPPHPVTLHVNTSNVSHAKLHPGPAGSARSRKDTINFKAKTNDKGSSVTGDADR